MSAAPRIRSYDDSIFDAFKTFDVGQGFGEVDDPFPTIHALHREARGQSGDLRKQCGLRPFDLFADLPSAMVFGKELVERVFGNVGNFSNGIMQRLYASSFGESINGMDPPEHTRYRRLFQRAFMPNTVALLDRLPNLHLDPDHPPPRMVGFNSRAPLAIQVRFDPVT